MILITGTGRAGTSVLADLMAKCGLDPGTRTTYDPAIRAGFETPLPLQSPLPELAKSPALSLCIPELVKQFGAFKVIVPVRDRKEAAKSRFDAGLHYWKTLGVTEDQVLGRLIEDIVLNDLEHILLAFPRWVLDPEYAWDKLKSVLPVNKETFFEIYSNTVNYKEK